MKNEIIKPDHNGHLFPADPGLATDHQAILQDMVDLFDEWAQEGGDKAMPAGYTYWGQFIAHDVAPRVGSGRKRSSALDLDSLYGTGWHDPEICLNVAEGTFLPGFTSADAHGPSIRMDLFRRADKSAVIPEPRNEDNLILSQFHLLLQRFHNAVVQSLLRQTPELPPQTRFEKAAANVSLVFRRLTLDDFLPKIVDKQVYKHVIEDANRYFEFSGKDPMPKEITAGVFRFGHSLVRQDYHVNARATNIDLAELFELTGPGGLAGYQTLPTGRVIDWQFLFTLAIDNSRAVGAGRVDPFIVQGMRQMRAAHGQIHNIARKNLQRGIDTAISSGQQCVEYTLKRFENLATDIGLDPVQNIAGLKPGQRQLLHKKGVLTETPLWLYVLLEGAANSINGACLGPFASLLVCESVRAGCENAGQTSTTELTELQSIKSMADLINWIDNF